MIAYALKKIARGPTYATTKPTAAKQGMAEGMCKKSVLCLCGWKIYKNTFGHLS